MIIDVNKKYLSFCNCLCVLVDFRAPTIHKISESDFSLEILLEVSPDIFFTNASRSSGVQVFT